LGPLISCNCLRDSKPIDDVFLDKFNHILRRHLLQWNCLNPFSEVICSQKHKLMPLARWWINLANQVYTPTPEWPWLDNGIQC
jgi:hypothetical protein